MAADKVYLNLIGLFAKAHVERFKKVVAMKSLVRASSKARSAVYVFFVLLIFLFSNSVTVYADSIMKTVVYGRSCSSCFLKYVDELKTALEEIGITEVELRYLESDVEAVEELGQLYQRLGVPEDMRGGIVVVSFDDRFLFEDVPVEIIVDFLVSHAHGCESVVVFRDVLGGLYRVLDEEGVRECEIESSISECLGEPEPVPLGSVLLLVVVSGFLDGINPCAFAVLLFFIAVLFAVGITASPKETRRRVLMTGSVYIVAIFLSYLLIGLVFIKMIALTPFPHLVAKAGALLMIFLGFINVKDYLWPGRGFSLGIPESQWETIGRWMHKFTLPAAFVVGLMVGLFEFPCTGGIYVAILGLLALRTRFLEGLVYLILYNLAFVLPLIGVLAFAHNKRVMHFSLVRWKRRGHKALKLLYGLVMVTLGIFLLLLGFT